MRAPRARHPFRAWQDDAMRIHIAADHAGYALKTHLVEHLEAAGHEVVDHGAHEYDELDDYPSFCFAAGEAVVAGGERQHTLAEATAIVEAFLAAPFSDEDRHRRRISQLAAYEATR